MPSGTAFFGASNGTNINVIFNSDTTLGGFTFNPGASNYNLTVGDLHSINFNALIFTGAGIVINGGSARFTVNGELEFNNASTAGTATIIDNNQVVFNNNSSANRATITNNAAFLVFSDHSTAGNATIVNNGALFVQFSSTAGSANITNTFGSFMDITQNSTAGNATITNSGFFTLGNNSTAGTARLINTQTGDMNFSNSAGPNNDGKLSAGSIEGAGTVVLGASQFTVGSNNLSTAFSGVISDCGGALNTPCNPGIHGAVVKVGAGTLALSGINTYTGATTVNGGTLEVDGSIASSSGVVVNSSGTLAGSGSVSTAAVNASGTLAPGNSTNPSGTLSINGNLTLASSAFYLVQISGTSASKANVTGTASLGGTAQVALTGSSQLAHGYDILHSAGLGGTTFSGLQTLAPGFEAALSYTTTDVFLNLTANLGSGSRLNANQQNVATTINSFFNAGGTLPPGFVDVFNLSGAPLANALTQISGETATAAQQTTFDAMGMFMGLLTDPFMNRGGAGALPGATGYPDEALGYAGGNKKTDAFAMFAKAQSAPRFEQRWSVWASGFGGSQNTNGNAALGSNNTTSNVAATAVGADYPISPNTVAGFALAGGGTSFSVANGGTGRSDLFQAGAYVRHNAGPAYISAALAYGWQDIATNRTVTVAGVDQLRAQFNANAFSSRLEGGYRFVSQPTFGVGITPYAAAQFVTFDLPAYAEQALVGLNTFALAYGARNVTDPRSELGVRTDKSWTMNDGVLTLRGRFAWAHDFDPDRSIEATFQSLPGASFVVNGAAQASDSALTTASIEMKWKIGWSTAATFEGEFSNVTRSYAGKGVLRYVW